MALLECSELTVTFGGVRALDGLDFKAEEGMLVGLIGPNGAGKTTFIDAITGFVPATGRIRLDGREISHEKAHRRARFGLGRSWQSLELFEDLSVGENLRVAAERASARRIAGDFLRPRTSRPSQLVRQSLRLLGIQDLEEHNPAELSLGQRKLVSVARALACGPKLLCMDEPAAGLDTAESSALGDHLRAIRASGTSIMLVDHDMGLVLGVCDYIYVIDFGRLIAEGPPATIRSDESVIKAYLGTTGDVDAQHR